MSTNELDKYKTIQKTLSSDLSKSKTAYTPNVAPTQRDLKTQLDLMDIKQQREKLFGEIQEERWYAKDPEASIRKKDEGLLMRGLNLLGTPLYGIVGGVEAVLGKGTKPGLANIPANIREGGTFGDLLRMYNVPWQVSAPVGFALDLAFDPLMWATGGASAAIPKIAFGAYKKGAIGAAKGAEASGRRLAATMSRVIPRVDTEKLLKGAAKSEREYDTLVGRSIEKIVQKRADTIKIGEMTENWLQKHSWGKGLIAGFKLRNRDWFEAVKMEDMIERLRKAGSEGDFVFDIRSSEDLLKTKQLMNSSGKAPAKNLTDQYARAVRGELEKILDEGAELATVRSRLVQNLDNADVTNALRGEAEIDEIVRQATQIIKEFSEHTTGVKWFDDSKNYFKNNIKVGDVEVGKKILKEYDRFINLFKIGKIGGNTAAYTNALVGNLTMAMMAGIHITRPGYIKSVGRAWSLLRGKVDSKMAEEMLSDPAWLDFLEKSPLLFKKTYGISRHGVEAPADVGRTYRSQVLSMDDVSSADDAIDAVSGLVREGKKRVQDEGHKSFFKKMGSRFSRTESVPEQAIKRKAGEVPSTYISSEIFTGDFGAWVQRLRKKAESGDKAAAALHWYLTTPMSWYEKIDQSYKLGTAFHLTKNGLTERELLTLSKVLKINPKKDLTYVADKGVWRLSPERATEAAQEMFMNYAAMPGVVKVLRSLPVFGAPFASFMYAMTMKTGKTLMHNPAVFNKINFAMHEFSPAQSPLEKYALEQPYYQWYKRGGMIRLPIFRDNPIYINVANMIPYYTMNMFEPSDRSYSGKLPSAIAQIVDRTPFFSTPEGQVMFDYFIQPVILRESNPRGIFDQQLWPTDASNLEKIGYAGRQMVEAVVPPVSAIPGALGVAAGVIPEQALPFMPSYRLIQLGNAMRGRTPLGVQTKEGAVSKTVRTLTSMAGLPVYPLKLEYTAYDLKKNLKNVKDKK